MIVHTGDCTELLDQSVKYDVMIVDPPYSKHVHKNATSQSAKGGARHRELGFEHLTDDLRIFIAHGAANIRRWSLIYSDVEGLADWRKDCIDAGVTYIRPIPWVRWSMPQLSGDRPPTGCEFVTAFWGSQKGRKSWNGPGNLTHLAHTCLRGDGKHKTEKPLDQLLDLVSWFTNPGDHVVDLCAGAGTTGLACRLLGREFTGFELDPNWAKVANDRLHSSTLSERDEDRYQRWLISQNVAEEDVKRRKANTSRVRSAL